MASLGEIRIDAAAHAGASPSRRSGAYALGRTIAVRCCRFEWLLIAVAAPTLLFPAGYTPIGALLIFVTWLSRRVQAGAWSLPTRAHPAMLLLALSLLLSVVPSVAMDYTTPKFWGLALGMLTFYAVLNTCVTSETYRRATVVLLVAGLGLGLAGLIATAASADKGILQSALYSRLPRLLVPIQSSTRVTEGLNPNEVGGMLTLFVPLAVVIAFAGGTSGRRMRLLAASSMPVLLLALVLTQSRAAIAGVCLALAIGALALVHRRLPAGPLVVRLLLVTAAACLLIVLLAGRVNVNRLFADDAPIGGTASLAGRAELWVRALDMFLDMPLTGVGLNTFPIILREFYPTASEIPESLTPHAHNLFLQTAVDLGMLGLAGFLTLLVLAVSGGISAIRNDTGPKRVLAFGLLLGLLAYAVFSAVDAVTLGAKPGPALWAMLALLIGFNRAPPIRVRRSEAHRVKLSLLMVAVVAIAVVPAQVNAARLVLHHNGHDTPALISSLVADDLELASYWAWGPYVARVWAARAVEAGQRGDRSAQIDSVQRAVDASAWDSSLILQLGEDQLSAGDTEGAVAAWRSSGLDTPFLVRASQAPDAASQLRWLALAREVNPRDWRAYADAAWILVDVSSPPRPEEAASLFAEALHLRGPQPALDVIAARLESPFVSDLPVGVDPPSSQTDIQLLGRAAAGLATLTDYQGAVYANQLIARAEPTNASNWLMLARMLRELGRVTEATEIESHWLPTDV